MTNELIYVFLQKVYITSEAKYRILIDIVTCLLEVGIAEPEETVVARKRRCKHVSTATKSRDRCINTRNNRGTIGGFVFCWVRAEAI
jgi:hypothetical protein